MPKKPNEPRKTGCISALAAPIAAGGVELELAVRSSGYPLSPGRIGPGMMQNSALGRGTFQGTPGRQHIRGPAPGHRAAGHEAHLEPGAGHARDDVMTRAGRPCRG